MGKPTGFMEFDRVNCASRPPEERVQDWEEFRIPLPHEERICQGARCMNCGTPFCQSGMRWEGKLFGCPLHNLIPEWNNLIYEDNVLHALSRLQKTNNFPEFTGRVCPAPCEGACICGQNDPSITIRDNELWIIDEAFRNGEVKPRITLQRSGRTVAVIGSGPAGLAAADQLNHRGHSVTVFEREERPGGLLTYGIPSMKLRKDVVFRRTHLMEQEGVVFRTGCDCTDLETAEQILNSFDAVILCCGAENARKVPFDDGTVDGICTGTQYLKASAEDRLSLLDAYGAYGKLKTQRTPFPPAGIPAAPKTTAAAETAGAARTAETAKTAQTAKTVETAASSGSPAAAAETAPAAAENADKPAASPRPLDAKGRSVVIIGTGDTASDCVATAIRQGASEITQLVRKPREFYAAPDGGLPVSYAHEEALAVHGQDPRRFSVQVDSIVTDEKNRLTAVKTTDGDTLDCSLLICATGFSGCREDVCRAFSVDVDRTVSTEPDSHAASRDKVFTAGDMRIGSSLVVTAIAEGRAAAAEVDEFLMGYTNLV